MILQRPAGTAATILQRCSALGVEPVRLFRTPHGVSRWWPFWHRRSSTVVLVLGIKESANFNTGIVVIKVSIVLFLIARAAAFVVINIRHWRSELAPFIPPNAGEFGIRLVGLGARSGGDFLRLHWFRCGLNRGAGSQESTEGYAHWHYGFAGDLYGSVHRWSPAC